jgi:hypothetical protein
MMHPGLDQRGQIWVAVIKFLQRIKLYLYVSFGTELAFYAQQKRLIYQIRAVSRCFGIPC